MSKYIPVSFLLFILSLPLMAQESGVLTFLFKTKYANEQKKKDEPLTDVTIKVTNLEDGEELQNSESDKKGKEVIKLPYGKNYRLIFESKGKATAFVDVFAADVPEFMYKKPPSYYETVVIMVSERSHNASKYKCAYGKVVFVEKRKGFMDDIPYKESFMRGTVKCKALEPKKEKVEKKQVPATDKFMTISIGGKLLAGEDPSIPIANTVVYLIDDKDNVLETTSTNILGAFVFKDFRYEQKNVLRVKSSQLDLTGGKKILFVGKGDQAYQATIADTKGAFEFKLSGGTKESFKLIEITDEKLKRDIIGKLLADGEPVVNSKMNLKNENGTLVQSATTDKDGKFVFKEVDKQKTIVIAIDTSAKIKEGAKVELTNEYGKTVKQLTYKANEEFEFKMLPLEQKELSKFYADDPWLKVMDLTLNEKIEISEQIYFEAGSAALLPEAKATLDKVVNIMKQSPKLKLEVGAHTDSKGSDESNLKLSQKRAEAAVAYMEGRGIKGERLKAKGYGESKLVNKCENGVECTENEHAVNRRVSFKVL